MWGGGKGGRARLLREARRYRRREELRGRQCVSSVLGWCVWVNLEGESARAHCLLPPPSSGLSIPTGGTPSASKMSGQVQ